MAYKEYQKSLPVGFRLLENTAGSSRSEITLGELEDKPNTPIIEFRDLEKKDQIKLSKQRIEGDEEFQATFYSHGPLSKKTANAEIANETSIGDDLLSIEGIIVRLLVEEATASPHSRLPHFYAPLTTLTDQSVLSVDSHWGTYLAASTIRERDIFDHLPASKLVKSNHFFANRVDVANRILNNPIKMICGAGHGTRTEFKGYQNITVFSVAGLTPQLVSNRIIHLFSCLAACELGLKMSQNGAVFAGYTNNIAANSSVTIRNDARFAQSILSGKTTGEAKNAVLNSFAEDALRFVARSETRNAACMRFNSNNFQLYGPENVTIDTI